MPFQFDPPPGENEIECARCGASIYFELSRCPECGVNLYEPESDQQFESLDDRLPYKTGFLAKIRALLQRLLGKPYSAEDVFGDSLNQAILFRDLLAKVGGDHEVVERLIAFERRQFPNDTRPLLILHAIRRWERDNRITDSHNSG